MDDPKSFDQKLARIYELTGVKTDTALAKILGIKPPSVAAARKRQQLPGGWIEKIAEQFEGNANWLLFGIGPKYMKDVLSPEYFSTSSVEYPQVKVIGLASCSIKGWYNPSVQALTTPAPQGSRPEVFAVLAVGFSMAPRGIQPGNILYCDPTIKPANHDVVYIEKQDGTAAIKSLRQIDDKWLTIEGWLDPDATGKQEPYNEKLSVSTVKSLASVVYVRLKA